MYHKILNSNSFIAYLYKIDRDFYEQAKKHACQHCQAPLHTANYLRKPRNREGLADHLSLRFSLSCSRDGCRKRIMPPSVRFFSRFIYWSVYVVLISAMLNNRQANLPKIARQFCVDIKTVKRWRDWWQDFFPTTNLWKKLKGDLLVPVKDFPQDLLTAVDKNHAAEEALGTLLKLLTGIKMQIA